LISNKENEDFLNDSNKGIDMKLDSSFWYDRLEECSGILIGLNEKTETDFIHLGDTLDSNNEDIKNIILESEEVLSIITGNELEEITESLTTNIETIKDLFKKQDDESRRIWDSFMEMKELMKSAFAQLKDFSKSTNKIQVFGISTRIAISRFTKNVMDFKSLADNITQMSDTVKSKMNQIERSIETLFELLDSNIKKIDEIDLRRKELGEDAIIDMKNSVFSLKKNYQENFNKIEEIHKIGKGIESKISGIVTSVQFHDISRQRLEHVIEALNDQKELITGNDINIEKQLPEMKYIIDLELIQLDDTKRSFLDEISNAKNSLEELNISFTGMSRLLTGNHEGREKTDFLEDIGNQIRKIMKDLNSTHHYEKELLNSMTQVNKRLMEIRQWMEDLDVIGIEIDMIAQNARIKAFHAGVEGRELGVIAESIQQLSIDVRVRIKKITQLLYQLLNMTRGDDEGIVSEEEEEYSILNKIGKMMNDHLESLKRKNFQLKESLNKIITIRNQLNRNFKEALTHFNVDELFNKEINKSYALLKEMSFEIKKAFKNELPEIEQEKMEVLRKRYTMERERKIHESIHSKGLKKLDNEDFFSDNVDLF